LCGWSAKMLFLHLGLPIHSEQVLFFDDDECSDLVNRFGGNLKRLRSLHVEHILEVLGRAKKGGHIRWHILATEEAEISSNFRGGCPNTYYVSVGLEVIKFFLLGLIQPLTPCYRNLVQGYSPML
jgi:hypothetical protein